MRGEVEIDLTEDGTRKARLVYEDGLLQYVTESHINSETGEPCGGTVWVSYEPKSNWGYKGEEWEVLDDRPDHLTLTPSINCSGCKSHGYITDGRWGNSVGWEKKKELFAIQPKWKRWRETQEGHPFAQANRSVKPRS